MVLTGGPVRVAKIFAAPSFTPTLKFISPQTVQKSKHNLKFLGARIVTSSKFCNVDPHVRRLSIEFCPPPATRPPKFVYPCSSYLFYRSLRKKPLVSTLNTIYLEQNFTADPIIACLKVNSTLNLRTKKLYLDDPLYVNTLCGGNLTQSP